MWLYIIIVGALFAGAWFIGQSRDTFSKILAFVCAVTFVIVGLQLAYCIAEVAYVIVVGGMVLVFRLVLSRGRR
jgi:hypothetical protein